MEGHVRRLQEELQRERDERNFYQVKEKSRKTYYNKKKHQLERDRIDTFWEVTRRELEETRAEVRVKDR